MSSRFDLSGRVAVIIGGTSGIGRAIAKGFEEHGARSIAAGRRSQEWPVDVADRSRVDALRDRVLEEFGSVDILVNAAGYTFRGKPTESLW